MSAGFLSTGLRENHGFVTKGEALEGREMKGAFTQQKPAPPRENRPAGPERSMSHCFSIERRLIGIVLVDHPDGFSRALFAQMPHPLQ